MRILIKLASTWEGLRHFYADTRKLEKYVRETQLPRALAQEFPR